MYYSLREEKTWIISYIISIEKKTTRYFEPKKKTKRKLDKSVTGIKRSVRFNISVMKAPIKHLLLADSLDVSHLFFFPVNIANSSKCNWLLRCRKKNEKTLWQKCLSFIIIFLFFCVWFFFSYDCFEIQEARFHCHYL